MRLATLLFVLVAAALASSNAPAQAKQQSRIDKPCFVFEFRQYKTSQDVRHALERCHPLGSDASELLKHLKLSLDGLPAVTQGLLLNEKVASLPRQSKYVEIVERFDYEQSKQVTVASFGRYIHVGRGNHNAIYASFILSPDQRIHLARVGIGYVDQDYLLRKMPFRFDVVVLAKDQLKKVLLAQIGTEITRPAIDRLMRQAGATFVHESTFRENTVGALYIYEDKELNNLLDRFVGRRNEFDRRIVWHFSNRGEFLELMILK